MCFWSTVNSDKFVKACPPEWHVENEKKGETTATLVPRVGRGHFQIDDCVLNMAIGRYGKILSSKRCKYTEFEVENGVRQFVAERVSKPLPSCFQFGRAGFMVSHKGQIKVCHKCGSNKHNSEIL